MIRAICFDFDGVLTTDRSGSLSTLRSLSRHSGIAEDRLWEAIGVFNDDLLLGRTHHAAIWPEFCARLGATLPFALLERAFTETPMNTPMLALAAELKHGHAVGLITDNKADRMAALSKLHDLPAIFDPIMVSAEVGSGKDGPAIFEHALALLDVAPGECLFIDNTAANLQAPAALGMATLHFDDARNDVASLRDAIGKLAGGPAHGGRLPGSIRSPGRRRPRSAGH